MVEQSQDWDRAVRFSGRRQGLSAGMAGEEIVDTRCTDQITIGAGQHRGGKVMEHHIPPQHGVLWDSGRRGHKSSEATWCRPTGPDDGGEVVLGVQHQSLLVDASI